LYLLALSRILYVPALLRGHLRTKIPLNAVQHEVVQG